ncbi:MAG: type II toxin-antitoxin system prevent-host-death family antitoxin [Planctomycetes bacterium]|nr:type II toxin-antitoxin system prevent-host-death family antitoxin [Planctomycetota bacterium]
MKTVRIAELKANLSAYLRRVRAGDTLVVLDRETPVARVVPFEPTGEPLSIRRALRTYPSLGRIPLPPPLRLRRDAVEYLLEERQGER